MSIISQLEREEMILDEQYEKGLISLNEYNAAWKELQEEYAAAAEEAAQEAYEEERARWNW